MINEKWYKEHKRRLENLITESAIIQCELIFLKKEYEKSNTYLGYMDSYANLQKIYYIQLENLEKIWEHTQQKE